MTFDELVKYRADDAKRRQLITDRLARIEARRFTGDAPTDFGSQDFVVTQPAEWPDTVPAQ